MSRPTCDGMGIWQAFAREKERSKHVLEERRLGEGGVWNPKGCAPKIAINISCCKFFPIKSGTKGGYAPSSYGCQPFQYILAEAHWGNRPQHRGPAWGGGGPWER